MPKAPNSYRSVDYKALWTKIQKKVIRYRFNRYQLGKFLNKGVNATFPNNPINQRAGLAKLTTLYNALNSLREEVIVCVSQ